MILALTYDNGVPRTITIIVLIVAVISDSVIASTTTGSVSESMKSAGVIFKKSEAIGNMRINRNKQMRVTRLKPAPFNLFFNDSRTDLLGLWDWIESILL